jgi:hypothetical protein
MSLRCGIPMESQIFSLNWSSGISNSSCEMKYPLSETISFTVLYALHRRDVVLSASSISVDQNLLVGKSLRPFKSSLSCRGCWYDRFTSHSQIHN